MLCTVLALSVTAEGENWPQFRGPTGNGHAASRNFPTTWSENENIHWKAPVAGLGWSSPVVWSGQIWLTTAIESEGTLRAVCYDRDSGQLLHDIEVFKYGDLGRIASKNSHASPTPVIDGRNLFVHFGAHGTACLTLDGQIVWTVQLKYDHRHGPGSSPVVWNDLVIVPCDAPDKQFLVALDKRTGNERWRVEQAEEQAYSTPIVVRVGAQDQVIASRGNGVIAHDPRDGRELWRVSYQGHSVVPRPVVEGNMVYVCTGYWNPTLLGIKLGGSGDVTTSHVAFSAKRGVPHVPSPVVAGGRIYMTTDLGILTCLDAVSGKELWRERLSGNYAASPTLADGKIYLFSEEGNATVMAPGEGFQAVATNQLDGRILASPAFVDGAIYLRTDTHLYRIEGAKNVQAGATVSRRETTAGGNTSFRR
jgi:outer membrane protein assembly factor BamB